MPTLYKILHKYGDKNSNRKIDETVFSKQKSAYQFEQRSKKGWEGLTGYDRPITRMILKEGSDNWEQYTVIGNKLVTVPELENILKSLREEAQELQMAK